MKKNLYISLYLSMACFVFHVGIDVALS